jgi:hypothetical protein
MNTRYPDRPTSPAYYLGRPAATWRNALAARPDVTAARRFRSSHPTAAPAARPN